MIKICEICGAHFAAGGLELMMRRSEPEQEAKSLNGEVEAVRNAVG